MKGNDSISKEAIKTNMLQYAEDKYDKEFQVIEFNYAIRGLDSNYHDVLVLKDNGSVKFNVYSDINTNDCFDDYGMSVADKKISDYVKESTVLDFVLMVDLLADDQILPNDINSLSASQIINNYEVEKIIVLVKTDSIEKNIEKLYDLYQITVSLGSNLIDYEVVSSKGTDEKLDKIFDNVRLNYENDWNQYQSVFESLSTSDKDLTKEQFKLLIKEA